MKKFESLISPISASDFFENYWRKTPLYVTSQRDIASMITVEEINEYFSRTSITYPLVRIVGNGSEIDLKKYQLDANGTFNIINKTSAFKLFNQGNTLVIQAAHFQFEKLNTFVKELEGELGVDVNANIYITPSNSQGFFPHFDTHEVLVVQIQGSKAWNLYDVPSEAPIKGWGLTEEKRAAYLNAKPNHELTLCEGDVLYVPRGVVHDAYCKGDPSIHITFGFNPMVRLDLITELLKRAEHHSYFREPFLPYGKELSLDDKENVIKQASAILSAIIEQLPPYKNYEVKYRNSKNVFYILMLIDSAESCEEILSIYQSLDLCENDIMINDDEAKLLNSLKVLSISENNAYWSLTQIKSIMKSLVLKEKLINTEKIEA